jgi:hypothetical protein
MKNLRRAATVVVLAVAALLPVGCNFNPHCAKSPAVYVQRGC